jgi:glycosyltransferase involved in cell wall biosynthesis
MALRIGIEAQRIYREKKHGMDFVALEMIRNLQIIDKKNEYVIFVKPDIDKCLEETSNFKIVELKGTTYPYWEQILLPAAAKAEKIDVLHCTSNTAPSQKKIPLILTLHDVIYMEKSPWAGGSLYQKFGNMYRRMVVPGVVNNASVVITVSEFEKKVIEKQFPQISNKLKVVYNGKSSYFHNDYSSNQVEEVLATYNLPSEFIFFLGNTDPKKNLPRVIEAYTQYCREVTNPLKMVIADFNASLLNSYLSRFNAVDLTNQFVLPGYVPNKKLPLIFNKATFFLYPSLRESFGIPIIEAMACGTPVITSNAASMPEVSGGAAYLVDPKDVLSLKNGITTLANNKQIRDNLIDKGLKRATTFNWLNTAKEVLEIYEEIKKQ